MIRFLVTLLVVSASLFSDKAFANMDIFSSTLVASIETDVYKGLAKLEVTQDSNGAITGLVYHSVENNVITISYDQLRRAPQLLTQIDGVNVVYVGVENDFNPATGGHGFVRFLSDGMNNIYLNFRFLLSFEGSRLVLKSEPNRNDPDSDRNSYAGKFNYLFFKGNVMFGQVIGIESITPSLK